MDSLDHVVLQAGIKGAVEFCQLRTKVDSVEFPPIPCKVFRFDTIVEGSRTSRNFEGILIPICSVGGVSATLGGYIMSFGENIDVEYRLFLSFNPDIDINRKIGVGHWYATLGEMLL